MSAIPALKLISADEYLTMEDAAAEKHELIDGQVYAMAGASFAHNQITANLQGEIFGHLREKPCRIYSSDLKIHVKTASGFAYPDLSIICHTPEFLPGRKDIITNPTVLIEVLSAETEDYDLGKKFMLYRQIPSLKEYLVISSLELALVKYFRLENESWSLQDYRNATDELLLKSIDYRTTLSALYRDVVFEATSLF